MLHPIILDDDDPTVRRVRRELVRLEALAHRRRMRAWIARGVRGLVGAGGSFALLVKLKVAGSLGGKLIVAALVGLGLAWPVVALGLLALLFLVMGPGRVRAQRRRRLALRLLRAQRQARPAQGDDRRARPLARPPGWAGPSPGAGGTSGTAPRPMRADDVLNADPARPSR